MTQDNIYKIRKQQCTHLINYFTYKKKNQPKTKENKQTNKQTTKKPTQKYITELNYHDLLLTTNTQTWKSIILLKTGHYKTSKNNFNFFYFLKITI